MTFERLGDPARHFWMTRSVARAMGLTLTEALAQKHLSRETYAAMVTRCRRCPVVDHCEAWLATQASCAEKAPEGCLNSEVLNNIKREMDVSCRQTTDL